jgi:hypothetical protein
LAPIPTTAPPLAPRGRSGGSPPSLDAPRERFYRQSPARPASRQIGTFYAPPIVSFRSTLEGHARASSRLAATRGRASARNGADCDCVVVARVLGGDLAGRWRISLDLAVVRQTGHPVSLPSAEEHRSRITPAPGGTSPICKGIIERPATGTPDPVSRQRGPAVRSPRAIITVRPPIRGSPPALPLARMTGRRARVRTVPVSRLHNAARWTRPGRSHPRSLLSSVRRYRGAHSEQAGEYQSQNAQFRSPATERRHRPAYNALAATFRPPRREFSAASSRRPSPTGLIPLPPSEATPKRPPEPVQLYRNDGPCSGGSGGKGVLVWWKRRLQRPNLRRPAVLPR